MSSCQVFLQPTIKTNPSEIKKMYRKGLVWINPFIIIFCFPSSLHYHNEIIHKPYIIRCSLVFFNICCCFFSSCIVYFDKVQLDDYQKSILDTQCKYHNHKIWHMCPFDWIIWFACGQCCCDFRAIINGIQVNYFRY